MSKKKDLRRKPLPSPRNRRRVAIAISLLLTVPLTGGLVARWKAKPTADGMPATTGSNALAMPQALPSPPLLSKEYIYAGGRLVATEVPFLEADVNPRPDGSGSVTTSDWVRVGRFVAGLDTVNPGSEFQRADCAPKSTLGDGKLTVSDWVQAGRYAAVIDPPTLAGGPTSLVSTLALDLLGAVNPSTGRVVRVVSPTFVNGQNGTVTITLDSQGNENALGLSLSFNPAQLRFVSAAKGTDASAATLNVNSNSATSGRVGIALSLPSGQTFVNGTRQIVTVTFAASANGALVVSSGDQPVWREVADPNANALAATFTP